MLSHNSCVPFTFLASPFVSVLHSPILSFHSFNVFIILFTLPSFFCLIFHQTFIALSLSLIIPAFQSHQPIMLSHIFPVKVVHYSSVPSDRHSLSNILTNLLYTFSSIPSNNFNAPLFSSCILYIPSFSSSPIISLFHLNPH